MRNVATCLNLTNDVLELYSKIHDKKLENLFTRLAAINLGHFDKWLYDNKKFKTRLNDPNVFVAMEALSGLRRQYQFGEDIPRDPVSRTLLNTPNIRASIPAIIAFNSLLNQESVKDLLMGYKDIISVVVGYMKFDISGLNLNSILQDLISIKNAYISLELEDEKSQIPKGNVTQQKRTLFQYLLRKFSDGLANAAEASGMSELSAQFSNGIIAKPIPAGLASFFQH